MKPLGKGLSYVQNTLFKPVHHIDNNRIKLPEINNYKQPEAIRMNKENILQNRMMRMRQVTAYLSLSRGYIYKKINEGTFPTGYMISAGIRLWDKNEIDMWLEEKMRNEK